MISQKDFAHNSHRKPQATVRDMTYNDHEQFGDSVFRLEEKIVKAQSELQAFLLLNQPKREQDAIKAYREVEKL